MSSATRITGAVTEAFVARSEAPADELGRRALLAALADSGLELGDVDLFVVGSRFEHPSIGQRILSPLAPTGATVINTENACASGSVGIQIADAYLRAGMARAVAVVGVERPSDLGSGAIPLPPSDRLGRAGVTHPVRYALDADEYCSTTGTDPRALAWVSVKNRAHAATNPAARFQEAVTLEEVLGSPMISTPLTRLQCCANADGAAALVLERSRRAGGSGSAVKLRAVATGSGRRIDRPLEASITARLAEQAYEASGVGPRDVDVAEVYDAFSIVEVRSLEALQLADPGTAASRIAAGELRLDAEAAQGGCLVVNPGGGLLGRGHPLGASGVAQVVEVVDQLRGRAGARQVPGARLGLVHTLGGNLRELEANAGAVMVLEG